MAIKVLNEFLPEAEQIRLGGIKVGDTLQIDNGVLDTNAENTGIGGNRLTYIPRHFGVTLNNGTLTLAAGGKIYIPNGFESDETTPKFEEISITSNITYSNTGGANDIAFMVYDQETGGLRMRSRSTTTSGSISPSGSGYLLWYDTANNLIKVIDDGVIKSSTTSLPIALVTLDENGAITKLNNVFSDTGYIGDIAFFLPGMHGSYPYGYQANSLNPSSINFETTRVLTAQAPSAYLQTYRAYLDANHLVLSNEYFYDGSSNRNRLISDTSQILNMAETNCWVYCGSANKITIFNRAFVETSAYEHYNNETRTWILNAQSYLNANKGWALVGQKYPNSGTYVPFLRQKSTNGVFVLDGRSTVMEITYTADSIIAANTNSVTHRLTLLDESGNASFPGQITAASTVNATATSARWADLAEKYLSDSKYPIGTLIEFGGNKEITIAKKHVNGVISEKPGYTLNAKSKGQAVALIGKTKVRVIGIVHKNDKLVLYKDGVACTKKWYNLFKKTIGIALEENTKSEEKLIMSVVQLVI